MRSSLLLLTLLAACEQGELDSLPIDQAAVVIDDTDDWDMLLNWEAISGDEINELYARATVRSVSGGTCAGALIDDDVFMTAEHCHQGNATSTLAVFGYYGAAGDGDTSTGESEARHRLAQFGVPASVADDVVAVPWDDLRIFDCSKDHEVPNRDVAFWMCDPNPITFDLDGTTVTYDLYPGHVWGHYNVSEQTPDVASRVLEMSVSRICESGTEQSSRNLVMGYGDFLAASETCAVSSSSGAWQTLTDCFRVSNDHTGGASGGPIVDPVDHTIFGVVNGQNIPSGSPGFYDDACNDVDLTGSGGLGPFGHNIGAYVDDADAEAYTDRVPTGEGTGADTVLTGLMGTIVGGRLFAECPDDMLAAGIVGTTASSDRVGSFGLVCLHDDGEDNIQLDRAVVLSYGAADTGLLWPPEHDLNTFWHEALSSVDDRPHTLAMCPPGFFLRGLMGRAANRVRKITDLACENPLTGQQYFTPVQGSTTGWIGKASGGTSQFIYCPPGEYLAGMDVYAPGPTAGIQGYCRSED